MGEKQEIFLIALWVSFQNAQCICIFECQRSFLHDTPTRKKTKGKFTFLSLAERLIVGLVSDIIHKLKYYLICKIHCIN